MDHRARSPALGYDPGSEFYDEAFTGDGEPRRTYAPLLEGLRGVDLDELRRAVERALAVRRVEFRTESGAHPFAVDPIPRLLTRDEWEQLASGVAQRVRALNAFLADVYGERRIIAAGRVPARAVDEATYFEPEVARMPMAGAMAAIAGLDIVRDVDGEFKVLEDNVRTPSGTTYLDAARAALDECMPDGVRLPHQPVRSRLFELLAATLRAASPVEDPSIVVLSDGPASGAWFEHRVVAERLGVPVVTPADLSVRGRRLHARIEQELRPVDVVYRRTNEDRLIGEDGHPVAAAASLVEPLRAGTVGIVNAFGTGVADDKLTHSYVEEMVRFYLDEEPLLESVRTHDLGDPETRAMALGRLDRLVVKPRTGLGGRGILIGKLATPDARDRMARAIRERPDEYVAQELLPISRHPTIHRGRLEPRHVDLRPYAFTVGTQVHVVPGGLTRVAFGAGDMVVNSSRNGGGKDTWVLE
jgi:uncharacterized circularly permuted ATP-grasp superfamily protein